MKNKVICIIDDDCIYQVLIRKIIASSKSDYSVISFKSGNDAIESFKSNVQFNESLPEIILLDIEMPVMDGWDFLDTIKSELEIAIEKTSIYIVSSSISEEDKEKAKTFPKILGFFSKPINAESILEITKKHS